MSNYQQGWRPDGQQQQYPVQASYAPQDHSQQQYQYPPQQQYQQPYQPQYQQPYQTQYQQPYQAPVQPVMQNQNVSVNVNLSATQDGSLSYFDGGLAQQIGWTILGALITVCTLGICYPWALCMLYSWETKHTVINGHRLAFNGTAVQLFGKWIGWFLLTLITLGIYAFWLRIALKKWITKHTYFQN